MSIELSVTTLEKGQTIEGYMETPEFKTFDDQCKEYEMQVFNKAITMLDNFAQRKIFSRWWAGEHVPTKNFKKVDGRHYYEQADLDKAHNAILWACGQGCG